MEVIYIFTHSSRLSVLQYNNAEYIDIYNKIYTNYLLIILKKESAGTCQNK